MQIKQIAHDERLSEADKAVEELYKLWNEVSQLIQLGMSRSVWRQPYDYQMEDEQVLSQLSIAIDAVGSAARELKNARNMVIAEAVPAQGPRLDDAIKRMKENLLNLQELANQEDTERLLRALGVGVLDPRSSVALRSMIFKIIEVRSQGVRAAAEASADQLAPRGCALWQSVVWKFEINYTNSWTSIKAELKSLIQEQVDLIEKLRKTDPLRLLVSVVIPLSEESRKLAAALASARSVWMTASQYVKQARSADAIAVEKLYRFAPIPDDICELVNPRPMDLSPEDVRLAEMWASDLGSSTYWNSAMLSARRAERVAMQIYSALYDDVSDVSIQQVRGGKDERWKFGDIAIGRKLIDVKNARRSYSSPNSYSEHCVATFKTCRTGAEVLISGFLSDYVRQEASMPNEGHRINWIGECSANRIRCLMEEFSVAYLDCLWRDLDGRSRLPPWLFEFPSSFYERVRGPVSAPRWPRAEMPPAVALAQGVFPTAAPATDTEHEIRLLRDRLKRVSLSRPAIFLHIVDRFCSSYPGRTEFAAMALKNAIFCEGQLCRPLGLVDPLRVVSALIDTLCLAQDVLRDLDIDAFRLSSQGVLSGRSRGNTWIRIIAYCGGWIAHAGTRVRCGRSPLVLGVEQPCRYCGYLVCSDCGFCKDRCPGSCGAESPRETK
tara:strand:+ start:141 stop:2138 length:1998 start_codon:yes stop_codon:yes gene_type:complete